MNIESILNWLVPIVVLLVFAGIFYVKLKEPVDAVFHWIKMLFVSGAEKASQSQEYTTVYKYS